MDVETIDTDPFPLNERAPPTADDSRMPKNEDRVIVYSYTPLAASRTSTVLQDTSVATVAHPKSKSIGFEIFLAFDPKGNQKGKEGFGRAGSFIPTIRVKVVR
jgi:hypothetical protein